MEKILKIIELLSDGKFHSGEEIGSGFGVSRSAIWKSIKQIENLGIEINTLPKRGYQIPGGLELLQKEKIYSYLSANCKAEISDFITLAKIDSTNDYLLNNPELSSGTVCLAEQQTNGRGRRGKKWESPFGMNIYLSILWKFSDLTNLGGLSIAIGVGIINALRKYGVSDLGIKWPNDIYHKENKLAGILIDIIGDAIGPCQVVIGIGLNLEMTKQENVSLTNKWTDICSITKEKPERNKITAYLIENIFNSLKIFQSEGLTGFLTEWEALDILKNKQILITGRKEEMNGYGAGIDHNGRLLVNTKENIIRSVSSGEVSVTIQEN